MNKIKRSFFLIGLAFAAIADSLRGRALATNIVFTPQETSHGTNPHMTSDVVIALTNAAVVRGSDDRHFKLSTASTDVPLGVLQRDSVDSGEQGVTPKGIALFGLYPESVPAVAAAAIAVDAELVLEVGTGRVMTLPGTTGTFYVVGRSRFAAAAANDPVSIAHCLPRKVVNP